MLYQNCLENFHRNSESEIKKAEKRFNSKSYSKLHASTASSEERQVPKIIELLPSKHHYRRYAIFTNLNLKFDDLKAIAFCEF